MKTIGLIGGMSWESTVTYYERINETVNAQLGGLHSAKCVCVSVDFAEIEAAMAADDWAHCARMMIAAGETLVRAGADFIVICTNTMHKVAPEMQAALPVPVLHIAEVTAQALHQAGIEKAGLLGTHFTMQEDFYTSVLEANGVQVCLPDAAAQVMIDRVIFDELCHGVVSPDAKAAFLEVIDALVAAGAQGIVLGCTELGMLLAPTDAPVPLFDTAHIHAEAAARTALA